MKNSWEWEEDDLLDMVKAKTQESIELDFKESKALHNVKGQKDVRYEISKDVSALANSAGGVLIYGMVEDKHTHVAASLDAGSDPTVITKEWLQQIINSTIHRKIDGVRVNQIPLTKHGSGNVAYVVYVPQSTRTAHQALDKKFYKRYEFESVPMEEYEVRDLYNRSEVPDLRIEFMLQKTEVIMNQEMGISEPFRLGAGIFNDAIEPANYAIISFLIDARLKIEQPQDFKVQEGAVLNLGVKQHPVTLLRLNWSIPAKIPIFQHPYPLSLTSNSEPFMLRTPTDGRLGKHVSYLLGYEIGAPRMPLKRAYTLLQVESGYITLSNEYFDIGELIDKYDGLFPPKTMAM
jgi:Putative DNA-binding domain